MMFNGMNFQFGNATISVNSIDTEKATGYVEVKIPVKGIEISISLKRWKNWNDEHQINLHLNVSEVKPKDEDETDYQDIGDEEDEEESANN